MLVILYFLRQPRPHLGHTYDSYEYERRAYPPQSSSVIRRGPSFPPEHAVYREPRDMYPRGEPWPDSHHLSASEQPGLVAKPSNSGNLMMGSGGPIPSAMEHPQQMQYSPPSRPSPRPHYDAQQHSGHQPTSSEVCIICSTHATLRDRCL